MTISEVLAKEFDENCLRFWDYLKNWQDNRAQGHKEYSIFLNVIETFADDTNTLQTTVVTRGFISGFTLCSYAIMEHGTQDSLDWETEKKYVWRLFNGLIETITLNLIKYPREEWRGDIMVGGLAIPVWFADYCLNNVAKWANMQSMIEEL